MWWNEIRSKKPQTFTGDPQAFKDPTEGKDCDFCRWDILTATDTFGRSELPGLPEISTDLAGSDLHIAHAKHSCMLMLCHEVFVLECFRAENASSVTASNLFKYAFPCHGLVIFKHHNPLEFTASQVCFSSTLNVLALGKRRMLHWSQDHSAESRSRNCRGLSCLPCLAFQSWTSAALIRASYLTRHTLCILQLLTLITPRRMATKCLPPKGPAAVSSSSLVTMQCTSFYPTDCE